MPANNDPVAELLTLAAGIGFISEALSMAGRYSQPVDLCGAGYVAGLVSQRARELGKVMWSEDYQPATRRRTA